MHPADLSSLAAAIFLAITAVILGLPGVLLLLSAACMCSWASHGEGSLLLRQISYWAALLFGAFAFIITIMAL